VTKINQDRLRALLAEHSVEPTSWWQLRQGETGALLDDVRRLATDPATQRQTWDALDQVVDDGNRNGFFGLLLSGVDTEQFRRLLTAPDPEVRNRTRWKDTRGYQLEPLIRMTLELLADPRFDYAWPDCVEVLRQPWHFDIMVDALAEADQRERLWVTLGLPADTQVPEFLPGGESVECLWDCDVVAAQECKHLPILVALLGSSLEDIREEATRVLCLFGPGATDALRAAPRQARRGALAMLAEFGWHHLPPADRTAVTRLIRVKQRVEVPEPLDFAHLVGSWYALPTTDQAAVLEALDLRDPVPATMRMGFAPWQGKMPLAVPYCGWTSGDGRVHESYPEVFVTPALDGWTLVFTKEKLLEIYPRMERLSVRFGTAHWHEQLVDDYAPGCWSQWCAAQNGAIQVHCESAGNVRIHHSDEIDPTVDRLHAWLTTNGHGQPPSKTETAYVNMLRESHYPPDDDDELTMASPLQDEVFGARGVSRRLSVNLEALGQHTRVEGTGVLAVPTHLRHNVRRGALPV
jgi:hypothetical protein